MHLDAQGFKGPACEKATEAYLKSLNPNRKGDRVNRKPEYHQQQQQTEVER